MDELCTSSIDSARLSEDNGAVLSHRVSVRVLGLKSVVSDPRPSVRVVVALLDGDEVTGKTAISTEFGTLSDEETMSMAIWEDGEKADSALLFNAALKRSSLGTLSEREKLMVVCLVDANSKEPQLVCHPIGMVSLHIKAFGDVERATLLAPVLPLDPTVHVPPFCVDNPGYKPEMAINSNSTKVETTSGKHKAGSFARKRGLFFGRFKSSKKETVLSPEPTQQTQNTPKDLLTTTLRSGVLLLDVSWTEHKNKLETISEAFPALSAKSVDESASDPSVTSTTNSSENSSIHLNPPSLPVASRQGHSFQVPLGSRTTSQISCAISAAEATVPTSNCRKNGKTVPQEKKAIAPLKQTDSNDKMNRNKVFWVVAVKGLKRRFHKKTSPTPLTQSRSLPMAIALKPRSEKANLRSVVSNLSVSFDESVVTQPKAPKCSSKLSPEEGRLMGTTSMSTSPKLSRTKPSMSDTNLADDGTNYVFTDDLFAELSNPSDEMEEEEAEESRVEAPSKLEFFQKSDPFESHANNECHPEMIVFGDESIAADASTVTMMRVLHLSEEKNDNQLSLFTFLPECAAFDGDASLLPVIRDYGNILDDDDETLETIDTYLKAKRKVHAQNSSAWWNDDSERSVGDEKSSLGGYEYYEDTDILRSKHPVRAPVIDDDLTYIPRPEDLVLSEIYRGCGVRTAEYVADGIVLLPEMVAQALQKAFQAPDLKKSHTLATSSVSSVGSELSEGPNAL